MPEFCGRKFSVSALDTIISIYIYIGYLGLYLSTELKFIVRFSYVTHQQSDMMTRHSLRLVLS